MNNITIITNEKLNAMLETDERFFDWLGTKEVKGLLYTVWKDKRTGTEYAVREIRTVRMGFNSNEEGKVEEFISIVEREGACQASWGVTGRTMHLCLANQLAKSLPQYEWVCTENYGCTATKK